MNQSKKASSPFPLALDFTLSLSLTPFIPLQEQYLLGTLRSGPVPMGSDDATETVPVLRELQGREVVLVAEFLALVKCNQKTFHIRPEMKSSPKAAKEG